jgi:hypothetical protein
MSSLVKVPRKENPKYNCILHSPSNRLNFIFIFSFHIWNAIGLALTNGYINYPTIHPMSCILVLVPIVQMRKLSQILNITERAILSNHKSIFSRLTHMTLLFSQHYAECSRDLKEILCMFYI